MLDLNALISHWGYLAIFFGIILGNVGLPIPEETVLVLAGFLAWGGRFRLPLVLAIGIVGAVAGDNMGYWAGRRYGLAVLKRYGSRLYVTADRFERMQRIVKRYGPSGVFVSRFLPGLRFMAGPLAGTTGLPFFSFFVSNVLGAIVYAPTMVGLGYAIGYGLGQYVERFQQVVRQTEHILLLGVIVLTVMLLGWRAFRSRTHA
ncbi:MAG: DedA family protein [Candidatus Methylomirabilales bacterium]